MLEQISQLDYRLFEMIHFQWSTSVMDQVMPILREKTTWIPVYLLIIGFLFWQFNFKSALYFVTALVLTVALTDVISSRVIKNSVDRERPCQRLEFKEEINKLVPCGGGKSFPSSHAANHFALSFFLIFSLGSRRYWIKLSLIIWATLISLAQIYVGLHFPLDIIGGAVLGIFMALLIWRVYKNLNLRHIPLY